MPLRKLDQASGLVHQISGARDCPTIVYLPGVHGDWTPHERARPMLSREAHFIETAYPRLPHWALDDFSDALEDLLKRLGIESAHLVGESFGSLVAWQFGLTRPERVRSLVLVGGFAQAPRFGVAAAAGRTLQLLPTFLLEAGIDMYVALKNTRGELRCASGQGAYPVTRTDRGRRATANRMAIIQRSDFRGKLTEIRFPVRYLGGARDVVVPVRREIATLRRELSAECGFQSRIVSGAPHPMIASHPDSTVQQILRWVHETEQALEDSSASTSLGRTSVRTDEPTL